MFSFRDDTFSKVSPEATARPVSTEGSQSRLVSQAWNSQEGQVSLEQPTQNTKKKDMAVEQPGGPGQLI